MGKNKFDVHTFTTNETLEVLNYWTPDKIANALPINPLDKELLDVFDNEVDEEARNLIISQDKNTSSVIGEPYEVNENDHPYDTGGKFLFSSDSQDFQGSAQFCGHCQIILTAAHCVKNENTGENYKNFAFARAYREVNGEVKQELFAIDNIGAPQGSGRFPQLDYAFCRTTKSFSGISLPLKIGNPAPDDYPMKAIGYPINYSGGKIMIAVDGKRGNVSNNSFFMKGNPLGPGCSGGAIMVDIDVGGIMYKNLVVGLNSRFAISDNTVQWSPLFDQSTIDLFNRVLDATGENPRRC